MMPSVSPWGSLHRERQGQGHEARAAPPSSSTTTHHDNNTNNDNNDDSDNDTITIIMIPW